MVSRILIYIKRGGRGGEVGWNLKGDGGVNSFCQPVLDFEI